MQRLAWFAVAVTGSLALVPAQPAAACSSSCLAGSFVPGDGAHVPANLPGLIWRAPSAPSSPDPARVSLTRLDTGATIALTATASDRGYYTLVPAEPLVAGVSYHLADATECALFGSAQATFTVTEAAPLPTALGTVTVTPRPRATAELMTTAGSCSVEADIAPVEVALAFTAEAEPWRDVLHFETLVDEQPWAPRASILSALPPGASWKGRGVDLVYSVCVNHSGFGAPSVDLPLGAHAVGMRAVLPGTGVDLYAEAVGFTTQCEAVGDDGGLCDGGLGDHDAAAGADGGGGGCAAGGSGAGVAIGLALGGLIARRRRAAR